VGPRAGLDGCRKSRPSPIFDPQTVQSVASSYTDYRYHDPCHLGSGRAKALSLFWGIVSDVYKIILKPGLAGGPRQLVLYLH
jgi:hypothetical protein